MVDWLFLVHWIVLRDTLQWIIMSVQWESTLLIFIWILWTKCLMKIHQLLSRGAMYTIDPPSIRTTPLLSLIQPSMVNLLLFRRKHPVLLQDFSYWLIFSSNIIGEISRSTTYAYSSLSSWLSFWELSTSDWRPRLPQFHCIMAHYSSIYIACTLLLWFLLV